METKFQRAFAVCFAVFLTVFFCGVASATTIPITAGCTGSCGTDTTGNGDVLPAPGFSSYTYITTTGGVTGGGTIPAGALGSETNGSTLMTGLFSATAGSQLQYYFNYITSDGSGFPDYTWAELESSTGKPVALLFTAETQPSGTIAPGVNLPSPVATLTPSAVPIGAGSGPTGGPVWSELGTYSGLCWAAGCGLTGWVKSDYTVPTTGSYELAFGVSNINDTLYDSGLAIDGITIAGTPIPVGGGGGGTTSTPEPCTFALLGMGMGTLPAAGRRKLALK